MATKTIAVSEIYPTRSHKHSFHGIIQFRELLGEQRSTFHARFVYARQGRFVFSDSFVTWYDDCEFKKNPKCKNQWKLYYPDTQAISKTKAGDTLLIARIADDKLLLVMTPPDSPEGKWIADNYSKYPRPKIISVPKPVASLRITFPQSFTHAKKILMRQVYANDSERQTFYCGCDYSLDGKIDPLSCGYVPRRPSSKRSQRLEWEHIVPVSYIGKGRACWESGNPQCTTKSGKIYKGRKCCEKVDAQFRAIEADLNNLVPSIGELNADRRDFPYRAIHGEERAYGACDFEVDAKLREAEPAAPLRGFIGRTWLYMNETYGVFISEEDARVYKMWADTSPPQQWEKDRVERIRQAITP